jgi:hypothetical protein
MMDALGEEWRTGLICQSSGAPKPILANAIIALRGSFEWCACLLR